MNRRCHFHTLKKAARRILSFAAFLLPFLLPAVWAPVGWSAPPGLLLNIDGNRMSLHAQEVPVRQILEQAAASGLRVKMDPAIDFQVSADFSDMEIRAAFEAILKTAAHILVWETVEGPVGPIVRLAEVQVFQPGRKERMRRLSVNTRRIVADVKTGAHYVDGELLIRLKSGITREAFQRLLEGIDGRVVDADPTLGIYRIRIPEGANLPALSDRLSEHPSVDTVEPNYAYPLIPSLSTMGKRPFAFAFETPTDIQIDGALRIAVLDSGISPEAAGAVEVASTFNAVDPDTPASDDLGHGTRMALIASGEILPAGTGIVQRQRYPIVAVKAFDEEGFVSAFDFARSTEFAAAQDAKVMSLSWGSPQDSRFLKEAVAHAGRLGMTVVAAAGNEPTGKAMYPAAYDAVIGVGALAPSGKRWDSSNFGEHVAVYAPGFAAFDSDGDGISDEAFAGTSVSTAFVSHLIAGLLSQQPEMTREQVIQELSTMPGWNP
jgi:hypothetical protein